jgi:hypothetical protein
LILLSSSEPAGTIINANAVTVWKYFIRIPIETGPIVLVFDWFIVKLFDYLLF